ncbi:c-type cytochrome [Mucilaginibacter sp.]|uniref:c-type cytochrome n=1 Tax=Mucilaginibacter sp. TaxID=1882438 RepID=UPI00283F71CB|nr:c-type cytochrome [Mucilaginibacter sp.]MDR3697846.1 c-type cytochrome [Mucilaginibacter sp.]
MKKLKKVLLYAVIFVVLAVISVISYVTLALPDVGKPENITVALTPQRVARGEYLANHVTLCVDCHSKRDWTKLAAPVVEGSMGGGGEVFDASVGFPGSVNVPNITPYKLKDWTDGEIFRAITCGVRKNGEAIFPLMPWPYYSKLSREDVYSIIAYLRTLKPIVAEYPKSTLDFPLNILVHTMPQKAALSEIPPSTDTLKYGEYLTNATACKECHSQDDKGKLIAGLEFAGGHEYQVSGHIVRSANITPDKTTGIGNWTQAEFLARFRAFSNPAKAAGVGKDDFQTIMPWYGYAGMSDGDLKAIYAYLRTLKPVKNKVEKFQAKLTASLEK